MLLDFQKMSTAELRVYLQRIPPPRSNGQSFFGINFEADPVLIIIPCVMWFCWIAVKNHGVSPDFAILGMPMFLAWVWFALVFVGLAVAITARRTAENKIHLQALTELLFRQQEGEDGKTRDLPH